jgi:hypothetical protein
MGLFSRQTAERLERRGAERTSVRLTAMLVYGSTSVGCTVRNISATGAAVLLPDGRDVPDEVTLVIVGKPAKHRARVVWRVSPLIALQFKTD